MKGTIVVAVKKLITEKFGKDKWEEILKVSGLNPHTMFGVLSDVDDNAVLKVVDNIGKVLNLSPQQVADAFGEYWVTVYAQEGYKSYFKGVNSAKEFLLKLDDIHELVTKNIENALPPRFEYEQPDDKTLIMKYKSERGLIDIFIGLIKGVGKFYNEDLEITNLGNNRVKIDFK